MRSREAVFGLVALVLVIGYGVLGTRVAPLLVPSGGTARPTPTKPVDTEVPAPQLPGKIAFTLRGDVYLLQDGRYRNSSADGRSSQPNLSADGQTLLFVRREEIDGKRDADGAAVSALLNYSDVIVRPVSGANERIALTGLRQKAASGFHLVAFEDGPAIAPDGMRFAVIGSSQLAADLELYDLRTGSRLALLSQDANLADPSWSPDGKTIAVTSYTLGTPRILLIPVDGSAAKPLKITADGEPYRPSYSPDGTWLTYTLRNAAGGNDLHAVEVVSGRDVALTSDGKSWGGVFSPDGTRIAFLRESGGVIDLYAMDLGTALTTGGRPAAAVKLTQGEGVDGESRPAWSR